MGKMTILNEQDNIYFVTLPQPELIIFDLAGTIIDFGCFAPVVAFENILKQHHIYLSPQEIRKDMGLSKKKHLKTMLTEHNIPFTENQINTLYMEFLEEIESLVTERPFIDLCPGARELMEQLHNTGTKIATCTGYPDHIAQKITDHLKSQGLPLDDCRGSSTSRRGRPYPDLYLDIFMTVEATDTRQCIVLDDTTPGIIAGQRAGMYSIGVLSSGSLNGLSLSKWNSMKKQHQTESLFHLSTNFQHSIENLSCLAKTIRRRNKWENFS